jgi:hypothetical protein
MNNLTKIKGTVKSIEDGVVTVYSSKDSTEYHFKLSELSNFSLGEKVSLLILPARSPSELSRVFGTKPAAPVKPIKLANFRTLVSHMIKAESRLQATLETTQDPESAQAIKDQIQWLQQGISLFS